MTRRPSVWCSKYYFFSITSCKILCKNRFNSFFIFFYKFTKIKIKSFECPKSIRNYKKHNAWNIRCMVDKSFVPSTQRIILKIVGFYHSFLLSYTKCLFLSFVIAKLPWFKIMHEPLKKSVIFWTKFCHFCHINLHATSAVSRNGPSNRM